MPNKNVGTSSESVLSQYAPLAKYKYKYIIYL